METQVDAIDGQVTDSVPSLALWRQASSPNFPEYCISAEKLNYSGNAGH